MIFLVLCVVSAMGGGVVFVITTTAWIHQSGPITALSSYPQQRYQSLKRAVLQELAFGGIMGLGTVRAREVAICAMGTENFVPCHNVTANLAAGFQNGEELQRHCKELSSSASSSSSSSSSSMLRCLIPPPKAYRLPLRWPDSQDTVWLHNVKRPGDNHLHAAAAVRKMKRAMLVESSAQISFTGELAQITDDYTQQIAVMLGLANDAVFSKTGIRTVLDVGCCFGSLAAHFVSHNVITLTVDPYRIDGGNAQIALERGLPAVLGSLTSSQQLPVPSFAFDMVHCAIEFKSKDSITILEIDRILRPGGYFVWTSSPDQLQGGVSGRALHDDEKVEKEIAELANRICWDLVSQRGRTTIWQKTSDSACLKSRSRVIKPKVCGQGTYDPEFAWEQKQRPCLSEGPNARWHPVDKQPKWPNRLLVAPPEQDRVSAVGLASEEVMDDMTHIESVTWKAVVKDYWTLLTPLIFSDNPKRPSDDDPLPPSNLVRNVMDMNAGYGDFNAALLLAGKPVWVMNVIPTTVANTLPIVYDRGLIGIMHDWCEAFPTYPRTYDLVHGAHLLSLEQHRARPCSLARLFLEIDRILRPEGWVLLRDEVQLIEDARVAATQIRWDARIIEVAGESNQRLLVCQKTFWKA